MIMKLEVFPQNLFSPSSIINSSSSRKNPKFTITSNSTPKFTINTNSNPTPINGKLTAVAPPPTTDSGLLFREKLDYLRTLNVNPSKALEKNPNFRSTPLSSLKSVEKCLSSMGIERSAFGRIFDMLPQILTSDPYTHLYPIFDFLLNDVGLPFSEIRNSVVRCPRLLISNVDEQLRPTLRFLRELGFVGSNSIDSHTTVLLVSNVQVTLLPKLEYLMSLGFDYDEVVTMVLRSPGLLTFSIENNFKPKVDYFVNEMNGDLRELKIFPQFFSFSLEGKIKKRHRMLVQYGFSSLPLQDMLKVSDGEFNSTIIEMQLRLLDQR